MRNIVRDWTANDCLTMLLQTEVPMKRGYPAITVNEIGLPGREAWHRYQPSLISQ